MPQVDRPEVSQPSDAKTAWREFTEATTAESFCRGWLGIQCRLIPGVAGGAVFGLQSSHGSRVVSPVALWGGATRDPAPLANAARHAISKRRRIVVRHERRTDGAPHVRYLVASPAYVGGSVAGAVALDVAPRSKAALQAALRQLEWGSGWLEVLAYRQTGAGQRAETGGQLQHVLEVVASALGHARFIASATAFVTALATKLGCDRVSIGFIQGGRVRVRAVSHTAQMGNRTNLVRAIGAAMDEAIDQKGAVVYPVSHGDVARVIRAHQEISQQHGGAILTVPFARGDRLLGALTLERPIARPFDGGAVEFAQAVAALTGPMLEVLRRDDRWLVAKAIDVGRRHLARLVGPRHVGLKLAATAAAAAAVFLVLATGEHRVAARAVMEAEVRRVAVAPFDGYIREAPARAGDLVRGGALLAALDDRELRLERAKWTGQNEQYVKQQHHALAARNAAQIAITAAQIEQARAQLALIDEQLAKSRVVAGFDGVVVAGDLSQSLGAPVGRGQVLFQVAPLHAYRVVLQVDERDISDVAGGQRGQLLLAAAPETPLAFTVETITPVSTAREGRNYFRVEATLDRTPEHLRPGMEGVGKVTVDSRRLVWIWTRPLVDWAQLTFWTWTP